MSPTGSQNFETDEDPIPELLLSQLIQNTESKITRMAFIELKMLRSAFRGLVAYTCDCNKELDLVCFGHNSMSRVLPDKTE